MLGQATVAGFAGNQCFAGALACHLVASLIAQGANQIARARAATVRVFGSHVPESVAATVAAENNIFVSICFSLLWSVHIVFANAFSGNQSSLRVLLALTNPIVFGAPAVALARPAHVWVTNCAVGENELPKCKLPLWIPVEVWLALFTVFAHRVVLAIVANATRGVAGCIVDGPVKMTSENDN